MTAHLAILLAALVLDRLVGDPDWLWRRLPHPVVWIGRLIGLLDRAWNRREDSFRRRRILGVLAVALLLSGVALAGAALHGVLAAAGWLGLCLEAIVVAVFLAQKSLADHVARVADALEGDGLAAGRRAVSMIVGRDPDQLDEAGVCRAAIESLAENASDGVAAPWLWYLLLGLPGILAYKALNTADSMIGHMNERHRAFGWAAARLDDLANWPAARLSALFFAVAALPEGGAEAFRRALRVAAKDAPAHRSPNAGWPEGAVAGALDLALGGPRRYGELEVAAPLINAEGRRNAWVEDIRAALRLLSRFSTLLALATFALLFAAL
ncbi:adenosylcobinamide-phosphate synthase CbiB [Consotaella salsifontis]|uniref:Cobalamin biosynthesis protein CobD n=1 Tax=Consotaella salsifontis TaxID=1365950 RepID=A0A1T4SK23_9HYPH|nr:adenosylcobinamide-phosphate synthase CbiB [Consotaella salsifontis]SKA28268.1 adenosylcobinamide-phosphate synthase [Consotaella salsifontis]